MSDLRFDAVSTDGFATDDVHSPKETRVTPNLSEEGISGISFFSEFPVSHWGCFSDADNPPNELGLGVYNLFQ